MNPIEISSSDSDGEVEDSREHDRATTNTRILPPHWGSASNGQTAFGRAVRSKYSSNSGFSGPSVSSRTSKGSTGNHERLPSLQTFNRTLPSYLHLPSSSGKSIHAEGNRSRKSGNDSHGSYRDTSWPSSSNDMENMRNDNNGVHDNDLVMLGSRSGRVLPPTLISAKSMPTQHFASSSDTNYRPAIADDRLNISDERLIYQAALEDLNQPKVEASLPDGLLSVPLLRHQKIALAWMLQKETRSLHCLGGILADDQGLGKTISMISLIQMQKSLESKSKLEHSPIKKTEALNLDDDEDDTSKVQVETGEAEDSKPVPEVSTSNAFSKRRPAAGTLVVCPASVLRQWARELDEKVADEAKLSVLVYHGGNRTKDATELAKYDVVLTTYAIVTLEVPKQPLVDDNDAEEKNEEKYGLSSEFSGNKKRKKTFTASKKGKKGKKGIDSDTLECGSGPLAKVNWSRVILDEAQTIKNHRTQMARACCSLRAKRRWCLSGTPIQNAIDDLYSYFRFLRYEPYAVYKSFYNTIKTPISRNSVNGYKKLQAVLRAVMLRRTKGTVIDGTPIITLPKKSIQLSKMDFSVEERDFYMQLESASRSQFKAYAAAGTVRQNYASILLMLLRLRQACDHPLLVKGYNNDSAKASGEMAKRLPRDVLVKLLHHLESSAVCQACNDTPDEPVVTMCHHVFCYQCVSEYLTGDDNMCPEAKCKEQLNPDAVYTKSTLRNCISDGPDVDASTSSLSRGNSSVIMQNSYTSTKIKAVLEILQTQCLSKVVADSTAPSEQLGANNGINSSAKDECTVNEECQFDDNVVKHTRVYSNPSSTDGPIKAIIFSQWTGMLNLLEVSLNQFCIEYRRLDGTMSLAARDKAVKEFNTDPEITVMLMSLKAGNLGLNMVAACHVIMLDLWWNPTTEEQAVDRAHRIGQTRPVTVTRITVKDTVEDRILALQDEKRKMVASAFGEDQAGSSGTRLTVDDLKYLFMI